MARKSRYIAYAKAVDKSMKGKQKTVPPDAPSKKAAPKNKA